MSSVECLLWKVILIIPLLALFFLVVKCPCTTVLCCHLKEVWFLIGFIILLVLLNNGFKFTDKSCGGGGGSGH